MEYQNFKYLDNLVKSFADEITLDADIILDENEELKYAYGVRIEQDDLIIDGNNHFIDAKGKTRIFNISADNIILKNIRFRNAYSYEEGSSINHEGNIIKIIDCEFEGNTSFENGGAIVCGWNSDLKITSSRFIENHANEGAAICNYNGRVSISKSKFQSNTSQKSGGAIANLGYGILEISGTEFADNYADKNGGAIINFGELKLETSIFKGNSTKNDGGAINNQRDATLEITGTEFNLNMAEKYGGALINYGEIDLNQSIFKANTAVNDGGAISNQKIGKMNILDTEFNDHHAEVAGGAIINFGRIFLKDSHFDNNKTIFGGGAINNQSGTLDINNNVFTNNVAEKNGGAIINWKRMKIQNSIFKSNTSNGEGGAITCKEGSTSNILETEFIENDALLGCSISNYSENIKIIKSQFLKHTTNIIILNKNYLKLFNPLFDRNSPKNIIINDEDSKLILSGGKFTANSCDDTCIRNRGRYCNIDKTIFQNNTSNREFCEDIINESKLSITEPNFKDNKKTILNNGHVEARKVGLEKIQKIIKNGPEGTIDTFEIPEELKNDFGHLNKLIHENSTITLTDDITLENYELDFFEGGIDLDCNNLVIDGKGKTINARNKTRIFTVIGENITLKNIIFKNGSLFTEFDEHTTGGGAIRCINGSSLNLEDCTFKNSYSEGDGGAILNRGDLTSTNSHFEKSTSKQFGGAICNRSKLTIIDDKFKDSDSKIGSAIYNDGTLNVERPPKLSNNTSHYTQEIYNANIINAPDKNLEMSIFNTGEMNPKTEDIKSFTSLNNQINESDNIQLTRDITYNHNHDKELKNGIIIKKDLTIDGNGHSIDGKNSLALFNIKGGNVILKNLTIKNCHCLDNAIIENKGRLTLESCKFLNNKTGTGINVINNNGKLKITDSQFLNSYTKNSLIKNNGELNLERCNFINNNSNTSGAVINNTKETTIEDCNFKSNETKNRGGVFNNVENAILRITRCRFFNNLSFIGGGVLLNFGKINIENSKITGNISHNNGGGLNNQITGKIEANNTEFNKNKSRSGGAIWTCYKTDLILSDCTFNDNSPDDIVEN